MKVENDIRQLNIKKIQPGINSNKIKTAGTKSNGTTSNTSFTGLNPVAFFNFLDTNQAWGACFVDLGFMVLPRTATDFGRGADAGFETMRREGMGTTNHSSVGLYGAAAGLALATAINNTYNLGKNGVIGANSIYADAETLDMQGKIYSDVIKEANPEKELVKRALLQYQVKTGMDEASWTHFDPKDIDAVADIIDRELKSGAKKLSKEAKNDVKAILMSSVGGRSTNFRIKHADNAAAHTSRYSIDYIVENIYKLPKIFSTPKIKKTFENTVDSAQNTFIKAMKSMNKSRSLLGVGIASLVGVSTQPINMYLTKKKTGKSGFVGGGEEDKSAKFKAKKGLVASLFGAGVLASIGNPKNLIKDLQFKGFTPTIKQFKFIYGITIMSRFLASRNSNELTESTIKDTLGFANWLILGNFVQKLVAQAMDKTLIRRTGKGFLDWIQNSSLKSREEVLHEALGKKVFKNGKALGLIDMIKELPKNSAAKKQLRALTIAQLAGYAYSGLVLGRGIPKLNIYLTNKRMAKQAAQKGVQQGTEEVKIPTNNSSYTKAALNNFTGYQMIHG